MIEKIYKNKLKEHYTNKAKKRGIDIQSPQSVKYARPLHTSSSTERIEGVSPSADKSIKGEVINGEIYILLSEVNKEIQNAKDQARKGEINYLVEKKIVLEGIYEKSEKIARKRNDIRKEWCRGVMSEIDSEIIDILERLKYLRTELKSEVKA